MYDIFGQLSNGIVDYALNDDFCCDNFNLHYNMDYMKLMINDNDNDNDN